MSEIEIDGSVVRIHMTRGMVAVIDIGDLPLVEGMGWCPIRGRSKWYAKHGKSPLILMHRHIMQAKPGELIGHIDRDGLNNRRSNLRVATHSQNCRNKQSDVGVSGLRGVHWHGDKGKWAAVTTVHGKRIYGGYFNNPVDAARAYNRLVSAIDGEFAVLNEV